MALSPTGVAPRPRPAASAVLVRRRGALLVTLQAGSQTPALQLLSRPSRYRTLPRVCLNNRNVYARTEPRTRKPPSLQLGLAREEDARARRVVDLCSSRRRRARQHSVVSSVALRESGETHHARLRAAFDLALLALLERDVRPLALADVHLARAPDLDALRREHHLAPVREPPGDARERKQDREVVGREAEGALRSAAQAISTQ